MQIRAMNKRAKRITEQALSLSAQEREELLIALAASLGKDLGARAEAARAGLSDEVAQYLADAWDKGMASGPGSYASIDDIISEARRRVGDRA